MYSKRISYALICVEVDASHWFLGPFACINRREFLCYYESGI